jgi:hypothetical protein
MIPPTLAALLIQGLPPAPPAVPTGGPTAVPEYDVLRRPEGVPPPVIDGRLDDALWGLVTPRDDFAQVEPVEGAPPSQRTELRIAFDGEQLYVGVSCFDTNPAGIRGTQMRRDAVLDPDDRVEILIDPYFDRRNAFWFQIGPSGGKGDALIGRNGARFAKDWDGIFEASSSRSELGWFAEFAIPLATMGFDPSTDRFGFNLRRFIRRHEEEVQWSTPSQRISFFSVANAGVLTGIGELEPALGLDLVPFVVLGYRRDDDSGDRDRTGDLGLDLFWRLEPETKLALTLNTDFAETEVDARQVNLTRFPLFFPEKRDFFLEDSGAFFFGTGSSALLPFFSRRIGLDDQGQQVPLLGAAKLTSRGRGWSVGLLDAQTGESGEVDGQNLAVVRGSLDFFEQSDLGVIATRGDPNSSDSALTYGTDLNLRTDRFLGDRSLRWSSFVVGTENEDQGGANHALFSEVDYPNDRWVAAASYLEVGEDVDPKLGFVPRTDLRRYSGEFYFRPRPGGAVRQVASGLAPEFTTDREDRTEALTVELLLAEVAFESGELFGVAVDFERDVVEQDFELGTELVVPAEDYSWWRGGVYGETSDRRPWVGSIGLRGGEFFDGHRGDLDLGLEWRPNRHLAVETEYELRRIDLPGGELDVHLGRLRLDLAFDQDVSLLNFWQWDSASDLLGWNSRLRWILAPGHEAYLVLDQSYEANAGDFAPRSGQLLGKLGWTFRF